MSSDDDVSDELLALAGGGGSTKRPGTQNNRSKRRRRSRSEDESEVSFSDGSYSPGPDIPREVDDGDDDNPFTYQGIYKDEEDKRKLDAMNEMEREEILSDRQEQIQKLQERHELNRMVQRKALGRVKETRRSSRSKESTQSSKISKLEELKKRREEKKGGKRSRKRASDYNDGDHDDDDEYFEDGGKTRKRARSESESEDVSDYANRKKAAEFASFEEIKKIQLLRIDLSAWCFSPFFENVITGCFVRVCIGDDKTTQKNPVYRLCEIREVDPEITSRPYEFEGTTTNKLLKLKHGQAVRSFKMILISNSPITEEEYNRWKTVVEKEKQRVTTNRDIERKLADLKSAREYVLTEADVSEMIKQKQKLKNSGNLVLKRNDLVGQIRVAEDANDIQELSRLKQELSALENQLAAGRRTDERLKALAEVNKRNRDLNHEEARKIEASRAEEKKRISALRDNVANTSQNKPIGLTTHPIFSSSTSNISSNGSGAATPERKVANGDVPTISGITKPLSRFEDLIAKQNIDIDLGDF